MTTSTATKTINRSVFIEGREWFDKANGNSYFSTRIWVDGDIVATLPFQYGYGEMYSFESFNQLVKLGYISIEDGDRPFWAIAEENGFDIYRSVTRVNKSEMFRA
jgi:hypothetical protein